MDSGGCSVTCGDGRLKQQQRRWCNDPPPAFGGKFCEADTEGNGASRHIDCKNLLRCPGKYSKLKYALYLELKFKYRCLLILYLG